MRFDWDPRKAQENARKHDVTFEEAAECFADEDALDLEDPVHPERLILIGASRSARLIFTVYALRERGDIIRIISARKATRKERRFYEEGNFQEKKGSDEVLARGVARGRLQELRGAP